VTARRHSLDTWGVGMKVGDLIAFRQNPERGRRRISHRDCVPVIPGIVIEVGAQYNRVGVLWSDGDRIDYEPRGWLEVISESW